MPLSEHEQRVLQELEQALYHDDPAFADRVRRENVYRYAGRYLKWSVVGFVVGMVVVIAFFAQHVAVGFLGVLIMLASLLTFWTNLQRMGKAGLQDIGRSVRTDKVGHVLADSRTWLRNRFRRKSS